MMTASRSLWNVARGMRWGALCARAGFVCVLAASFGAANLYAEYRAPSPEPRSARFEDPKAPSRARVPGVIPNSSNTIRNSAPKNAHNSEPLTKKEETERSAAKALAKVFDLDFGASQRRVNEEKKTAERAAESAPETSEPEDAAFEEAPSPATALFGSAKKVVKKTTAPAAQKATAPVETTEEIAQEPVAVAPTPGVATPVSEAPLELSQEELDSILSSFAELNVSDPVRYQTDANELHEELDESILLLPDPASGAEPAVPALSQVYALPEEDLDAAEFDGMDAPESAQVYYGFLNATHSNRKYPLDQFKPWSTEKQTANSDSDLNLDLTLDEATDGGVPEEKATRPEPDYVADARSFGLIRPVAKKASDEPKGYIQRGAVFKRVDPDAAGRPNGFSSNAYVNPDRKAPEQRSESLDLGDVAEFMEEGDDPGPDENGYDSAILETTDGRDGDYFQELADENDVCDELAYALAYYSDLLLEYEPVAEWTDAALKAAEDAALSLNKSAAAAHSKLEVLKAKLAESKQIAEIISQQAQAERASKDPWKGGRAPRFAERYGVAQRLEIFDSFVRALERRLYVWNAAADYFAAKNAGQLSEQQDLTAQETALLLRATENVIQFFGDAPNGRSWRSSFDVDALAADARRVLDIPEDVLQTAARNTGGIDAGGYVDSQPAGAIADSVLDRVEERAAAGLPKSGRELLVAERAKRMRYLHDRINAAAYKIEKTPMTAEQRRIFSRPALAEWSKLINAFSGDQMNGMGLLCAFERYEASGGAAAGAALQQLAIRMTTSRSDACRQFGRAFDALYDNPNVKAYVSEALINRLLPVRDPEFAVVQERILDNPVVGTRRVDAQVSIQLVPDPNKLVMNLNMTGRAIANTRSSVPSATLHNESYVVYFARKRLEWTDYGVKYYPASVTADATNWLNNVQTDVDFVPLVGDLAREIARSQFQARQYEISEETRRKTETETRSRFDSEANERFDALNARMRGNFFRNLDSLGLSLRTQRSRTTDDWLLASLRLGSEASLGCQTAEPPTLPGAFADVKVHESAINAYLRQLELGGRETGPRETLDYLAAKLNRPGLRDVKLDEQADQLRFAFAADDPIVVRFQEDRASVLLNFDYIALAGGEWEDITVEIAYRPTVAEDGAPVLALDDMSIYGYGGAPLGMRELLPLRSAFAKIFPSQKTFELRPQIFKEDERFAGLALGLCRVSRGWFAVSVVRDPSFGRSQIIPGATL